MEPDAEQPRGDASAPAQGLAAELLIPTLGCLLTGYYLVSTAGLAWEAKATGSVVGVVLLALCLGHAIRVGVRALGGRLPLGLGGLLADTVHNRRRAALLALTLGFVLAMPWIGTTLGLFLALIAGMRVLGVTRPRQLVGIAATTALTVYVLLIALLDTRLPRGWPEVALAALIGRGG